MLFRKVKATDAVRKKYREGLKDPDSLTKEQLVKLVEEMHGDFQELNRIHNHTARSRGWCDSYERRQMDYNRRLKVFQLQGRNSSLAEEDYSPGLSPRTAAEEHLRQLLDGYH